MPVYQRVPVCQPLVGFERIPTFGFRLPTVGRSNLSANLGSFPTLAIFQPWQFQFSNHRHFPTVCQSFIGFLTIYDTDCSQCNNNHLNLFLPTQFSVLSANYHRCCVIPFPVHVTTVRRSMHHQCPWTVKALPFPSAPPLSGHVKIGYLGFARACGKPVDPRIQFQR